MQHEQTFVVDLLTTLRRDGFSMHAWWNFFQRSWLMSRESANSNPTLKRSWQRITWLVALLTLLILIGNSLFIGLADTARLLPGFIFCVVWQQSDLFWHLGLNRSPQSGKLLPSLGIANTLTWLRALGASYLLGRLVGGLVVPSGLALTIFLCGIVTDILDGQIARRTNAKQIRPDCRCRSRLLSLPGAHNHPATQRRIAALGRLRDVVTFYRPLVAALLSYIAFAHPIRFGSTLWGKFAGLAQCLYFLVLLAPSPFSHVL